MLSKVLNQGVRPGEFLLSHAERTRSLENVTITGGAPVTAGSVMGKVTAGGSFVPLDTAAVDGSEGAAGIVLYNYDATDADVEGVMVVRDAEVIGDALIWPDGIAAGDKTAAIAALADLGIIVR